MSDRKETIRPKVTFSEASMIINGLTYYRKFLTDENNILLTFNAEAKMWRAIRRHATKSR